uniref:Pyroglutamyl-peptidase I n=3 Tax=Rhodnius TaxID=13248 RepID=T1I064_RHOPR
MSPTSHNVVVVTGFGPFGPHKVNDSWECVKRLKDLNLEEELSISLVTQEIPVLYSATDKEVPFLWEKHKPALVVHVGVHNTENIVIERVARKKGYSQPDVSGLCPKKACCPIGKEECISTGLDLDGIISSVDSRGIHTSESTNAG